MVFSFIHAADLHLDSPLIGLAAKDPALADAFRQASRKALDQLVSAALEGPVQFVIIAGDIFDAAPRRGEGLCCARQITTPKV